MLHSMTGYGKSTMQNQNGYIIVAELRALNSKQLDLSVRLPGFLREKENEIRQLCSERMERGKVELLINIDGSGVKAQYGINKGILKSYYDDLVAFSNENGVVPGNEILSSLIRLPDVISDHSSEFSSLVWESVLEAIHSTLVQCRKFREQEGQNLEKDVRLRINNIALLLTQCDHFESQRIEKIRSRLEDEIGKIADKIQYDRNRFEQELIYYLEKIDITEEKVRLSNHLNYFVETMDAQGNNGRKLGFIAQEIGREINTIGSKANDAGIQKLVIQMKDELEKIREQLMNIL